MLIPFKKMHGLGNDFVVIDNRDEIFSLTSDAVRRIADRRFGVGCDQLIMLENPATTDADALMRIYNADGQEVGACGNASRCVGSLLTQEFKRDQCVIQTIEGMIQVSRLDEQKFCVDMGKPRFEWEQIPLTEACDTSQLPISQGVLKNPFAVSVGNPHMVFFVKDVNGIDLYHLGQQLTHHPLYKEGANVEIVEVVDDHTLKVRVYERGAGITMACGTGACASVIAGVQRKLVGPQTTVMLDGGMLEISYDETVKITGSIAYAFAGTLDASLFA